MNGALLAISILMSGPVCDSSDPAALAVELGSPRFARREAAELALTKLGRSALPALRVATLSKDPEVQSRATSILKKIEETLLVDPTTVDFDFKDVPLTEAIATINRRSGLKLTLAPEAPALWDDHRVTLSSGGPTSFWKAIDALCQAGQLHYVFGGQGDFEHGDSSFALYDGFASTQGVNDDRGPFRIQLTSLQYQSEVHLSLEQPATRKGRSGELIRPDGSNPITLPSKQFFLQMLVGAEPRLSVAPAGPVKVLEATDENGKSLVLPARGEIVQHESGYLGVNPSPLVHLRVDLAYPDRPSARLKKVRGLIPLLVSTRKTDPLEVRLGDPSNRTFRQGQVAITVGEVHVGQANQVSTVELTIKVGDPTLAASNVGNEEVGDLHDVASPQQLEVLDAAGKMIPWFPSTSFYNGEEAKLTLTLLDRDAGPVVPTMIRYHGLIRNRTEVPFEFRDLPMP